MNARARSPITDEIVQFARHADFLPLGSLGGGLRYTLRNEPGTGNICLMFKYLLKRRRGCCWPQRFDPFLIREDVKREVRHFS